MLGNCFLHFLAGYVLAAGFDHVFLAIQEVKPAMFITARNVAGMVPSATIKRRIGLRIFKVSRREAWPAQHDLSWLARWYFIHLFIHNSQLHWQMLHANRIGRR